MNLASSALSVLHNARLMPALVAAIILVVVARLIASLSRWRRITWRDQMDTSISLLPKEATHAGSWAVWKVFARHQEVMLPSLVLLRVRNSGFASVSAADIRRPITFTFPGREVKEFAVTDCRGVTREMIQPPEPGEVAVTGNRILLPRFPMRRGASFKLLVLLSGTDRGVLGKGRIRRGRVVQQTRGRGPMAINIAFGAVLAMLIGIQAGVSVSRPPDIPSSCGRGPLVIEGSTAFAPVARQIGQAYFSRCPAADVSVSAIATFNGLNAVNSAGHGKAHAGTSAQIAMSDGPAPAGYPALVGHPVAVIIFAVVVNKQAGVFNLTIGQLRGIYSGSITNWRQVNGANLPVRIISRTSGSGTRRAFDQKVLGGNEPAFSSYDCRTKDAVPSSRVIRCEMADTTTLLQRVNAIPGAIGYAQVSSVEAYPGLGSVKIDGWDPDIGVVERGDYPFWTVEYLYTNGSPAPGSPPAAFLGYVKSDAALDILRSDGYTPCIDRYQSLMGSLCRG